LRPKPVSSPPARFVFTFLLLLTLTVGAHFPLTQEAHAQTQQGSLFAEEVIAEISAGSEVKNVLILPSHLAWVESTGGKHVFKLDGKPQGGIYDDIKDLGVSPDQKHFVFIGKRGSAWILVEDGQERSPEYTLITSVAFQPHGDSIAYGACYDKKCKLAVDGTETGPEYEEISFPQYSHDGKRIAYLAKRDNKWVAVVDGKEMGPENDTIWGLLWGFSPDDRHFVYAASAGTGESSVGTGIKLGLGLPLKGRKWMWILDGNPGPAFTVISRIIFSADGVHYAYAGSDVGKQGLMKQETIGTLILDGQPLATYDGRGMGGKFAQSMISGIRGMSEDFDGLSTPQFNPEGKLVYAARRDKGDVAVFVGGEAGPGFDEILSGIVFTKDSQHFAYVAKRGKEFVEVQDNKPGRTVPAERRAPSDVPWIYVNADTTRLVYETVSGGDRYNTGGTPRALRSVIIDGKAGPEYNANGIQWFGFDKDAHHYLYRVAGAKGERDLVNADGHESRLYDFVALPRLLEDENRFAFIARDGSRFLRVTYTFETRG
jgi:hypothetical protein